MRYLALISVLASCSLYYGDPATPPREPEATQTVAERLWLEEALPVFRAQCMQCHASAPPSFLAGDTVWEIRDNVLQSSVVNIDSPETSRLLTKGVHSGPAMTASQASSILRWLQAERDGL